MRSNFDLITLDVRMPGISGLEIIAILRNMNPHAVIAVISGFIPEQVPEEVMSCIDVLLPKPVSVDAPLEMFDGEDRDVLVQGDLAFVHVVRSEGSVLIQGSIRGSAAQPIRVEATGDVVVTGAVHYGQLTGKRILIGGRSCHSQHTSSQSVLYWQYAGNWPRRYGSVRK